MAKLEKKPGQAVLKPAQGLMNPLAIANLMASAAHKKVNNKVMPEGSEEGKSYDAVDSDESPVPGKSHDKKNPGQGGTQSPSAPARVASQYSGEGRDEMSGGAESPSSKKKPNKSSQIQGAKQSGKSYKGSEE